MPIQKDKKMIILRCVTRLVRKNSNAFHLVGTAIKGMLAGNFSKRLVSKVFDFDPRNELSVEDLVAESLLNGLEEDDIKEIFERYARHKGLKF
jgi:hypothetical protein